MSKIIIKCGKGRNYLGVRHEFARWAKKNFGVEEFQSRAILVAFGEFIVKKLSEGDKVALLDIGVFRKTVSKDGRLFITFRSAKKLKNKIKANAKLHDAKKAAQQVQG